MATNNTQRLREYIEKPRGHFAYFNIDDDYLKWAVGKNDYDPIADKIEFCESVSNPCLISFGDLSRYVKELQTEDEIVCEDQNYITKQKNMATPKGTRSWLLKLPKGRQVEKVSEAHECPVKCGEDMALIDWYCDVIRANDWSACISQLKDKVSSIKERAITSIFMVPPFELLYWVKREEMFFLYFDHKQSYLNAAAKIVEAYEVILRAASGAGIEFVFYGAPGGTEFLSPEIWEEAIVPTSAKLEEKIRRNGLKSMYHCCGKVESLCRSGFVSKISPTIFETVSQPPVGDINDLRQTRRDIDKKIITHGNIDLTLLRDGTASDVVNKAEEILSDMKGYNHLIGASDSCLWPGTPPENIKTIMEMFD
jgi:hypothetical protein